MAMMETIQALREELDLAVDPSSMFDMLVDPERLKAMSPDALNNLANYLARGLSSVRHHLHALQIEHHAESRSIMEAQLQVTCQGLAWCGVAWCGVVWCGVVWCGSEWRGEARRGVGLHLKQVVSHEHGHAAGDGLLGLCERRGAGHERWRQQLEDGQRYRYICGGSVGRHGES